MTTTYTDESEHEDKTEKGVWVKFAQIEENDEIKNLKEPIAWLLAVIQKP